MRIEATWVEDQAPPSLDINARVCIPQVPMDERGLGRPPICLEWAKQAGNDAVKDGQQPFHLGILPPSLYLQVQRLPEALGEEDFPAGLPCGELR